MEKMDSRSIKSFEEMIDGEAFDTVQKYREFVIADLLKNILIELRKQNTE